MRVKGEGGGEGLLVEGERESEVEDEGEVDGHTV